MNTVLVFGLALVGFAAAEPNSCCPGGAPIVNRRCPNKTQVWSASCSNHAYAVDTSEFTINSNDTLIMDNTYVYRERYCLGSIETENETIALICFPTPNDATGNYWYKLVTSICCFISMTSLVLTLVVYCISPALRDLQGKCLMSNIFSLLMSLLILTIVQSWHRFAHTPCVVLASMMYFWFNAVFFWLNVIAFNLWCSVVFPKFVYGRKNLYLLYNIYGWGCPLIMTTIVLALQHSSGDHIQPGFNQGSCWFADFPARWAFFYGPISVILLVNISMFLSLIVSLAKTTQYTSEKKHRSHKFKCILYFKLFTVMGICWIFEPLSDLLQVEGHGYLWLATDIINSLQGLIIFFLLVVFRKRVRRDLANINVIRNRLPREWATIPKEDCEELEEEEEQLSLTDNKNNAI